MQTASQQTDSEPKTIHVKLLLAGGHQYSLTLRSDAPLLQELLAALIARYQPQTDPVSGLFQIPIAEGRSALIFPSDHLIGLETEPSVFVEPIQQASASIDALISHYIQIDNFLTEAENQQLLEYVFQQESAFVSTHTSTNDPNYRKSTVLYEFPTFAKLIRERIHTILPDVLSKLGLPVFPISDIEAQLTAHNDGNYYNIHNDNGSPDTATRELTYVYYFYRQPKSFSGGELVIYDSKIENNYYVQAESSRTVKPRQNSIVFFPSRYMHEVLPVKCPSQAFKDSRFTINGWIRR